MARKRQKPELTEAEKLERWQDGVDGFLHWIADVKPRLPSKSDGYTEFQLTPELEAEIREMFSGKYRMVVACWPRRHGKTALMALYNIWRFLTRRTQTIGIVANSATQAVDTSFRLCVTILRETLYTKRMIDAGTIRILGDSIVYDAAQNVIQGYPSNVSALHGKKLSVAQVSELHAANSQDVLDTFTSATADTADGILLIDSTCGPKKSPLYALYNLSKNTEADVALYYSHIFYKDYEDLQARKPDWIDGRTVNILRMNSPLTFDIEWLNKWSDSQSAVFPEAAMEKCVHEYPLQPAAICGEATYRVGGGLDRSQFGSLHADATITTAVLKTIIDDQEHFYVLDSDKITLSYDRIINKKFEKYISDFGMTHLGVEVYQAQSIYHHWSGRDDVHAELIHANPKEQKEIYEFLYYVAEEGRLHIHPKFKRLLSEMRTFEYEITVGQHRPLYKFAHAKGANDDTVYSMAWAIYSMRKIELNPYEIEGIYCNADKLTAQMCVLNGGAHVPLCSSECRSMIAVQKMYDEITEKDMNLASSLTFFVKNKLTNIGAHVVNR